MKDNESMESIETIKIMRDMAHEIGLKESEAIHEIIKNIEEGVYRNEAVSDITFEIFEGLMDIESLPEKKKQEIEKATHIGRVSGYRFFSPIINSLKEIGGSGKSSEVVFRAIEKITVDKKESSLNKTKLKNQIERAKGHLSKYGYIYSNPIGVWNLTGKNWESGIFSSQNYNETKDKFDAQYITDEELIKRVKQSINNVVKTTQITTNIYKRNHYVTQFARRKAKGTCQLCEETAPFNDREGRPYLETHHIVWLSAGGDDSAENVVALCPNCHAKMHILNVDSDIEKLKIKAGENLTA